MTIENAITTADKIAQEHEFNIRYLNLGKQAKEFEKKRAEDCRQVAEWLRELEAFKKIDFAGFSDRLYGNAIRRGRKEALERASEIIKAKGKEAIGKNAKWGTAEICEFCVDLIRELEKVGGIRMPEEEEEPVDD